MQFDKYYNPYAREVVNGAALIIVRNAEEYALANLNAIRLNSLSMTQFTQ